MKFFKFVEVTDKKIGHMHRHLFLAILCPLFVFGGCLFIRMQQRRESDGQMICLHYCALFRRSTVYEVEPDDMEIMQLYHLLNFESFPLYL